ncbi:MAG: O-antigen ligase family protein, partial [SAR324 cluster bacterium]|nr:O-antigen ligase family protein [SAR324 cluster bacterium]
MLFKILKPWVNPLLVGLLILFSMPLKLPVLQQTLESLLSFSFPIRLSLYTLVLPPVALFSMAWNRKRAFEIWQKLKLPLIVLAFLFCWMWLGAIMSEYPKIALKHSGRYSIFLMTFIAFLFALERDSLKKSGQIFTGIYVILMAFTFLDLHGKTNIPALLTENGLHIDLFFRGAAPSSFFENRNPYAVISVGVFFWSLANLRQSWILSSLAIAAASYSIVLAGSRNGILTLVICLLFLLILTFKQIRKARIAFVIVLVAAVAVGIGYYTLKSQTISRTNASLNRLLDIKTYKDLERMEVRFVIFRAAFDLGLADPPILGSGAKTFGHEVFSKAKDVAHLNSAWYKDAFNSHNAPLTIWIEMGWVGLLAVLLFLWLWFRPALRGPPLLMMPMLAVCVGQILDYFVWEIFFMAFQSFFFA